MNVISVPRRGLKRSRVAVRRPRMAVQRLPRTLRYNGENKITRTVNGQLAYNAAGFSVGAGIFQAINIVYDPTSVTFYGAAVNSVSFPIPNAAEIAALYDQIRIDKVEITWSSNAQANSSGGAGVIAAKFLVCNDSNDGIGTASLAEIQQQPNKEYYAADGRSHKWSCIPKYQRVIFQSVAVSNYEPTRGFVNSNSTIPHYGTKMAITNLTSLVGGASGNVDFNVKFFLTLKNVK